MNGSVTVARTWISRPRLCRLVGTAVHTARLCPLALAKDSAGTALVPR